MLKRSPNPCGNHRLASCDSTPLYIQLAYMYAPAWGHGGPTRLLYDYAKRAIHCVDVTVFTGDLHHDLSRITLKFELVDGIPVHRSRIFWPALTRKALYLISPMMYIDIVRRVRNSNGPVIIHFSDLRGLLPIFAMLLKAQLGKRVQVVHSAFGSLHHKDGWRRRVYDALLMKYFTSLVDLRLVQNEHERDAYNDLCLRYGTAENSKTVLVPLHVKTDIHPQDWFTDEGKNRAAVVRMRRSYGVPADALVFVFLGRLHSAKGILRLIDAYKKFAPSCGSRAVLLIIGRDDGFQSTIENYILQNELGESVKIINDVYLDRFNYYFMADVFLGFPTIFEETMLSSVEAMSCGTPILVSREADLPFAAQEGAGFVIDFSIEAAARALTEITGNISKYEVNAWRTARMFDGSHVVPALFDLLFPGIDQVEGLSISYARFGD